MIAYCSKCGKRAEVDKLNNGEFICEQCYYLLRQEIEGIYEQFRHGKISTAEHSKD